MSGIVGQPPQYHTEIRISDILVVYFFIFSQGVIPEVQIETQNHQRNYAP